MIDLETLSGFLPSAYGAPCARLAWRSARAPRAAPIPARAQLPRTTRRRPSNPIRRAACVSIKANHFISSLRRGICRSTDRRVPGFYATQRPHGPTLSLAEPWHSEKGLSITGRFGQGFFNTVGVYVYALLRERNIVSFGMKVLEHTYVLLRTNTTGQTNQKKIWVSSHKKEKNGLVRIR